LNISTINIPSAFVDTSSIISYNIAKEFINVMEQIKQRTPEDLFVKYGEYSPPNSVRDRLDNFKEFTWMYNSVFKELVDKELLPRKGDILVCGCGFGAELLALDRNIPDCKIHAVSLGDTPTSEVRMELGERLSFRETSILEALAEDARKGKKFDMVVLLGVASDQLWRSSDIVEFLFDVTRSRGHILEGGLTAVRLNQRWLSYLFDLVPVPAEVEKEQIRLWKRIE
jgi:hypothetical protein